MSTYVDAAPAREQLRALAANGFPLTYIAEQIGMSPSGLGEIRRGRNARTGAYAAHRIDRLHQQLTGTTYADHGIPEGPATVARLQAARNGWATRPERRQP